MCVCDSQLFVVAGGCDCWLFVSLFGQFELSGSVDRPNKGKSGVLQKDTRKASARKAGGTNQDESIRGGDFICLPGMGLAAAKLLHSRHATLGGGREEENIYQ